MTLQGTYSRALTFENVCLEVLALRLYTGPMYMHYNTVLRKLLVRYVRQQKPANNNNNNAAAEEDEDSAGQDTAFSPDGTVQFSTTIHMITSGIIKLSEIMRRPPTRKLYRGLSGMNVPECFFKEVRDALSRWTLALRDVLCVCVYE